VVYKTKTTLKYDFRQFSRLNLIKLEQAVPVSMSQVALHFKSSKCY